MLGVQGKVGKLANSIVTQPRDSARDPYGLFRPTAKLIILRRSQAAREFTVACENAFDGLNWSQAAGRPAAKLNSAPKSRTNRGIRRIQASEAGG